jgi:hypothetical protein
MNATRNDRFTALVVALVMTASLNGAMLWTFDSAAHQAAVAQRDPGATAVTLNTVGVTFARTA